MRIRVQNFRDGLANEEGKSCLWSNIELTGGAEEGIDEGWYGGRKLCRVKECEHEVRGTFDQETRK